MATIGTAYINIAPNMSGIQGKIAGGLRGSGSIFAEQFGGEISGRSAVIIGAIAGVAQAATQKGMQLMVTSIGDAVKRVDTLNQAAKTFQYMGFSAADSSKAVKDVTSSILGLPTPLDSAVRGMTALSATYGDVKLGQRVFSALNDAVLGFGGTTADVDGAIQQLSQLPLDGPLDAQTWNSLRNNGLTPVLVAMGKDMGRSVGQLKADFGSGKLTVQDFVNELTKIDTKGGGGLVSLQKIAHNATSGIGTGFQNMQTAITRGIANIIQAFGQQNISSAITAIGKAFETVLNDVSKFISFLSKSGALLPAFIGGFAAFGVAIVATMLTSSVAVSAFAASLAAAALAAAPFLLIGAAIGAGAFIISKNWDKIAPVIDRVKGAFTDFWKDLKPVRDFVAGELKTAFDSLVKIGDQVAKSLKPIIDTLKSILANKTVQIVLKDIGIALLAIAAAPIIAFFAILIGTLTAVAKILKFAADHFTLLKTIVLIALAALIAPIALLIATIKVIPTVVSAVAKAISAAFGAIASVWNSVLYPVFSTIGHVLMDILGVFIKVWAFIALVVIGTLVIIGGVIWSAMQAIWNVITVVWNAIWGVISAVVGFISGIIVNAWNFYYGIISSVLGAIWGVVTSVWNAVSGFIGGVLGTIGGIVAGAWNAVYGVIASAVGAVWGVVTSAFGNVVSFLGGIGGKIIGIFAGAGKWLFDVGKNIIQGLLDGAGSLLTKIADFFLDKLPGWIKGPFKKALGISSPSKLFYGYGQDTGQGYINAIQDSAKPVTNAVSRMADAAVDGISGRDLSVRVGAALNVPVGAAVSPNSQPGGVKKNTIIQNNVVNNNVDMTKVVGDMTWALNRTT